MTYALEALIVDPTTQAFRIGFSHLDASPLDGTAGTGFILDVSCLDSASLGSSYSYIWQDFTAKCTGIVSKRGSELSGLYVRGSAGTLTATFRNGGDTDAFINLGVGSPVRLRDTGSNHVVWTGVLADTSLAYTKGKTDYYVTWSCVDVMAKLSQKVSGLSAQTFAARMTSLAGMAGLTTPLPLPNTDINGTTGIGLNMFSTRYDTIVPLSAVTDSMSIAEHMDMACASTRSMYFPSENGNLTCSPDWGPGANADGISAFSDSGYYLGYGGVPSYTSIVSGLNSTSICNVLTVTNKGTGSTFSASMAESVARYGRREQSVTMCTTTDANAQIVASDLVRTASDNVFGVSQFSIPYRFVTVYLANPDPLGSPVAIVQDGKVAKAWVINEQIVIKASKKETSGQSVHYTYGLAPRQKLYAEN